MPWILTVSPRSLAAGGVEVTERATGERSTRSIEDVEALLRAVDVLGDLVGEGGPDLASCSCERVVPSRAMTASLAGHLLLDQLLGGDVVPVIVSSCESIRPIAKVTPGGIDAVIAISAIRYGERFSRSDALVISWSAVALMMRSARTPGSIRSTTVVTPRRAAPIAAGL